MEDSERLPRKLAAILYADVAGYSRLTGEDEDATHRRLSDYLDLIAITVKSHRGRVMHYAGDAVLAMFEAVVDALSCAAQVQRELQLRNENLPDNRKVQFRIGLNLGDVIEDRGDIYGDGVNVAARLESLAEPGKICISESIRTAVGKKLPLSYEFMGEQQVKNISDPIRAYKVRLASNAATEDQIADSIAIELPGKPSIAVLPFTNMSADPEQEYFADGMTDDIIAALSQISALFVIARNSTFVYKGKSVKVQDIARDLGVRYVLEGSVRKSGRRVRITAQLIDAIDGHHLWAERYDRGLQDIFEIQDEIARKIAIEMQIELTSGDHARIWQVGTRNFDAWQCQVRGMQAFYESTRESRIRALDFFERAVAIDPSYVAAWIALGSTLAIAARFGHTTDRSASLQRAEEIAENLLRQKETEADGQNVLANVRLSQFRHEEAVTAGLRSVELAPINANHQGLVAWILVCSGRSQQAFEHLNSAIRISPHYPNWFTNTIVHAHCLQGHFHEAREAAETAIARFPNYVRGYVNLAGACSALGLLEPAREAADEVLRRQPEFSLKQYSQTLPFQDQKNAESWIEHLRTAGLPD